MDRSYSYTRRLVSRARLRKRMAAVATAGIAVGAALFMLSWSADPVSATLPAAAPLLAFAGDADSSRAVRRVYPYSVIPGGVSGKGELARIIRTDKVVAAHYATFDVDKAHAVTVSKPRAVHVSYRKGGKVYWTAKKVMLAPGEMLLSDGSNEMRARCANRISSVAQYPVEAHAPAMEELDTPVEPGEGEQYAFGPDGMPLAMVSAGGIPRHTGQRAPGRSGGGGGAPGSAAGESGSANSTLSSTGMGSTLSTMGLSGSSSSLSNRPRPASLASNGSNGSNNPAPTDGSGSSGSQSPSGDSVFPAPQPDTGAVSPGVTPGASEPFPQPSPAGTGSAPGSTTPPAVPGGTQTPAPAPLPGTTLTPAPLPAFDPDFPEPEVLLPGSQQAEGGNTGKLPTLPPASTGPLLPEPEINTTPHIPPPVLTPEQQAGPDSLDPPANVPEPGSLWLFAAAGAALLLRRQRARVQA